MTTPIVRSGYDFSTLVQIRFDGDKEDLSAATIRASLKNADKSAELIADIAQSSASAGASWSTGLIAITFLASVTAALVPGDAWIEIAITKSARLLPCDDVRCVIETGYALG